jgi:hypothetical protein
MPHLLDKDGEFRTEHLAQPAGYAALAGPDLGRVIPLGIKVGRYLEHIARTVRNTQFTPFAAVDDQMNRAVGYHHTVLVERSTPKFHSPFLLILVAVLRAGALVTGWHGQRLDEAGLQRDLYAQVGLK